MADITSKSRNYHETIPIADRLNIDRLNGLSLGSNWQAEFKRSPGIGPAVDIDGRLM